MEGFKHLLRVHEDAATVLIAIKEIYSEFKSLGYDVKEPFLNMFLYHLEDGSVIKVYWENGCFWEDIHSYPSGYVEK